MRDCFKLKNMKEEAEKRGEPDLWSDEAFLRNEALPNKGIYKNIAYEIASLSAEGVMKKVDGTIRLMHIYNPKVVEIIRQAAEIKKRVLSSDFMKSDQKTREDWEKMDEIAKIIHGFMTDGEVDDR